MSATGGIKVFTSNGPVNALLDINGYFVGALTAPAPSQVVWVA